MAGGIIASTAKSDNERGDAHAYGRITTNRNRMLAISVPTKTMAGAGLLSSIDSRRISWMEVKPSNRIETATKTKAISTTIGPQNATMLRMRGRKVMKLRHAPGASR